VVVRFIGVFLRMDSGWWWRGEDRRRCLKLGVSSDEVRMMELLRKNSEF
jgi:hypothetical protein